MNESLLARRYAKALLEYATEVGEDRALYPLMAHLSRRLRHTPEERSVVGNPMLSEEIRAEWVVALAGEQVPGSLERFVRLVFDHHREALLGPMARAYVELYRRCRGITHAEVVVARGIDKEAQRRIEALVAERFGGTVEMEVKINPDIIGGFVLRVGGKVMDGSMKSQLDRIRHQFEMRNRSIV